MGDSAKHKFVEAKELPSMTELNAEVKEFIGKCSWFDRYGVDWLQFIGITFMVPIALVILRYDQVWCQIIGLSLLCLYHTCLTARAGHLACHSAMADSPRLNYLYTVLLCEFVGTFSAKCVHDTHIRMHHSHTNIIGLGDSSSWKVPFLPRYAYMFVAPLALPALIPFVALEQLIREKDWKYLAMFLLIAPAGLLFHISLLVYVSGFSVWGAMAVCYMYRASLAIPYIHINIFQHIGLPMYSKEDRPTRIYQMSTGCLNITPNPLFNFCFGHSLISCHVEHHLFPRLSDNMCLKVKPIVRRHLKQYGLPYHEDTYFGRLNVFLSDFKALMVNAPPITHFMAIQ